MKSSFGLIFILSFAGIAITSSFLHETSRKAKWFSPRFATSQFRLEEQFPGEA